MNNVACFPCRYLKAVCVGFLGLAGTSLVSDPAAFLTRPGASMGTAALAQTPALQPLSANDVSWLFPPPTQAGDFAQLISMGDLTVQNPQDPTNGNRVWSDEAFMQFLGIAASPAALVAGTQSRIGLPPEAQSIAAWHIAGIRIDPGAPGLSNDVIAQYGQAPQIRLIVQPVIRNADGTPTVLDTAVHLIFSFTAGFGAAPHPGCLQLTAPDLVAFTMIVAEVADLRTKLSQGQLGASRIISSDLPLGIHPGLAEPITRNNVRQEMKAFLERHLSDQRLTAMAIMGLPAGAPAPWIFLAMAKLPPGLLPSLPNGGFVPVTSPALDGQQFAEMLNPVGVSPRVVPEPHTNNRSPITCVNAALRPPGPPLSERLGSATAELFANESTAPDTIGDVLDLIADPTRSHFFNTDCVSCHTDTRRAMDLLNVTNIAGINSAVLPNGQYNVRNFGWSPPIEGPVQGTVTRRAAAETAAVVSFINAQLLGR
jgi:hypothetical protein